MALRKQSVEELQRTFRQARELGERWNKRLTFKNLRLGERYLEGELVCILRLRTRTLFPAKQYCAVFHRELRDAGDYPSHGRGDTGPYFNEGPVSVTSVSAPYEYQKLVFVLNTGLVEHPNALPVPSRVRLDMPEYIHHFCPGSLYFGAKKGFEVLPGVDIGNRESTLGRDRFRAGIYSDQMTRELVERRAQIMQYLTHDHGEPKRNILAGAESVDPLAGLRIVLSVDTIGLGFEEGANFNPEVIDLLFGPFDLGS